MIITVLKRVSVKKDTKIHISTYTFTYPNDVGRHKLFLKLAP